MRKYATNQKIKKYMSLGLVTTMMGTNVLVDINKIYALGETDTLSVEKIAEYNSGIVDKDGGVTEIVKFNKDNNKMYVVNGSKQCIDIVDLAKVDGENYKNLEK